MIAILKLSGTSASLRDLLMMPVIKGSSVSRYSLGSGVGNGSSSQVDEGDDLTNFLTSSVVGSMMDKSVVGNSSSRRQSPIFTQIMIPDFALYVLLSAHQNSDMSFA